MPKFAAKRAMVAALGLSLTLSGSGALAADPAKILRLAIFDIETLDPQQINDSPSSDVAAAIFEGLYETDYLATPAKLAAVCATGLPEVSDGGKTWTMHLQRGILFTDDAAFNGKRRELVAGDIVYSMKRALDPNLKRGGTPTVTDVIVGARAVVDAATKPGAKFDYDRPIAGLRALDRYTVQIRLLKPNFPVIETFVTTAAVAHEVVEAAAGDIRMRAVGTGPYKLRDWKQGSRIVLEANPTYRPLNFPESANPADADLVRSMRGVTLPQVGVIELNVIEEEVTRLLQFDRGKLDYVVLTAAVANNELVNGKLKPEYIARGVTRRVFPEPYLFSLYFNIKDAAVGGMSKEHIALRRAVALALDLDNLVDVAYAGQALPANQLVPPGVSGHDPSLPRPVYDPAAAKALLDRFGYARKDASGYRLGPDGQPLTITLYLRSGGLAREMQTLAKKNMDAIGIHMEFKLAPFQEMIKDTQAGKFQTFWGGYGGLPSGYAELVQLWGESPLPVNSTSFRSPDYDRAFEAFLASGDAAGQVAASRKMSEIVGTYVPMVPMIFRLENDFVQPWLKGFAPQVFNTYWKYLDIDLAAQRRAAQ